MPDCIEKVNPFAFALVLALPFTAVINLICVSVGVDAATLTVDPTVCVGATFVIVTVFAKFCELLPFVDFIVTV